MVRVGRVFVLLFSENLCSSTSTTTGRRCSFRAIARVESDRATDDCDTDFFQIFTYILRYVWYQTFGLGMLTSLEARGCISRFISHLLIVTTVRNQSAFRRSLVRANEQKCTPLCSSLVLFGGVETYRDNVITISL